MASQSPRIPPLVGAFTLVEVALAIAIVAFVLLVLAAVWPDGQDRLRGAIDVTIAAQLAQRVSAEVELADFADVLKAAGIGGHPAPAMGALPRRYFSYFGCEVVPDDPTRVYEVLTRVSHREQLPSQAGNNPTRWNAQGQLVLTIEVVASAGTAPTSLGENGLVDRVHCRWPVVSFPFIVGGHSKW